METKLKFKPLWRWPKDIELLITSKCKGFVVHVCNGESNLGDVRIDKFSGNTDIIGDMLNLPIKTGVADTVVCDPPYEFSFTSRPKLVYECRRILKIGGLFIYKGWWIPAAPGMTLLELIPIKGRPPGGNASVITILQKVQDSMFNDR